MSGGDSTRQSPAVAAGFRPAIYAATVNALRDALEPTPNGSSGLPVGALLEIIAAYAVECGVSTWFDTVVQPISVAGYSSGGGGGGVLVGGYGGLRLFESESNRLLPFSLKTTSEVGDYPHGICVDPLGGVVYYLTAFEVAAVRNGVPTKCLCTRTGAGGSGLVLSADRTALWFTDLNAAEAVAGMHAVSVNAPHARNWLFHTPFSVAAMAWSRSTPDPCTALYVGGGKNGELHRYENGQLKHVATERDLSFSGLVCTVSGHILASCWKSKSLWLIDPSTGGCSQLATSEQRERGTGAGAESATTRIASPRGIALVDGAYSLAVADFFLDRVCRVPLPQYLFESHK